MQHMVCSIMCSVMLLWHFVPKHISLITVKLLKGIIKISAWISSCLIAHGDGKNGKEEEEDLPCHVGHKDDDT